jgi:hypothetical protein
MEATWAQENWHCLCRHKVPEYVHIYLAALGTAQRRIDSFLVWVLYQVHDIDHGEKPEPSTWRRREELMEWVMMHSPDEMLYGWNTLSLYVDTKYFKYG